MNVTSEPKDFSVTEKFGLTSDNDLLSNNYMTCCIIEIPILSHLDLKSAESRELHVATVAQFTRASVPQITVAKVNKAVILPVDP